MLDVAGDLKLKLSKWNKFMCALFSAVGNCRKFSRAAQQVWRHSSSSIPARCSKCSGTGKQLRQQLLHWLLLLPAQQHLQQWARCQGPAQH
jgi:hypothetical protein